MGLTIALIGCSKRKNEAAHGYLPASELYSGDLFSKRVKHVQSRGVPWYILSAKSGLLKPTTPIRTYDKVVTSLTELERAEWHIGVANEIMSALFYDFGEPKLSSVTIEFHAGKHYCEPLASILKLFGLKVDRPVAGLGIGKQLAYYDGSSCEHCDGEGVYEKTCRVNEIDMDAMVFCSCDRGKELEKASR